MKDHARILGNFSTPYFRPWGSQGVTAAVASLFCIWITLTNVLLIAILLTNRSLRHQRQIIFVLHIALADLAVGLFYCPLTADFFLKQVWTHSCDSLFWWNTFFHPVSFLSTHCIGLVNFYQVCSACCRLNVRSFVKNFLTILLLALLWFYLICLFFMLQNFRSHEIKVLIETKAICLSSMEYLGAVATAMMVYFAPAAVTVILYVTLIGLRAYRPSPIPHHELNNPEPPPVISLTVLGIANVVSLVMPLPYFSTLVSVSLGSCVSFTCMSWILPVMTIFEWLLFAKSGIQPCMWLLNSQFMDAIFPILRNFRSRPARTHMQLDHPDADLQGQEDSFHEI